MNPLYIVRINPDKGYNDEFISNKLRYQHHECGNGDWFVALTKNCMTEGNGFHEFRNFLSNENGDIYGYLPSKKIGKNSYIFGSLKEKPQNTDFDFDVVFVTYVNGHANRNYDAQILGIQLNCRYIYNPQNNVGEIVRDECENWNLPRGWGKPSYHYVCNKENSYLLNNSVSYDRVDNFWKYSNENAWGVGVGPSLKIKDEEITNFLNEYLLNKIQYELSDDALSKIKDHFGLESTPCPENGMPKKHTHSKITDILDIEDTEVQRTIWVRKHQDDFRGKLLCLWNNSCCVTGCKDLKLIRASHIKPWAICSDEERLNVHNGLPLIGTLDLAFDMHLLSFNQNFNMVFAPCLKRDTKSILKIKDKFKKIKINLLNKNLGNLDEIRAFLKVHCSITQKNKKGFTRKEIEDLWKK